jgi:tetratricopeptide (TPR) repeat protein
MVMKPAGVYVSALLAAALACGSARAQQNAAPPAVDPRLPKTAQAAQLQSHAEELQEQGKYAEAAALFQKAAELVPDDAALWDRAGWAFLDAAQAGPALRAFQTYRKLVPPGIPSYGGLLVSHYALAQAKEAAALVKEAAAPDQLAHAQAVVAKGLAAPARSEAWSFGLGYIYARLLNGSPRGIPHLEKTVEANPKHAEAWLLLAELFQGVSDDVGEDAAAAKYLALAPETVDAFLLRGRRYTATRNLKGAAEEYQEGITRHPLAPALYFELARVYERAGEAKNAEATYRKLIAAAAAKKQEALQLEARAQLANFQARQQNYAAAETFYREYSARPDAGAATWSVYGSLLVLTGKWPDAAKALETAAARDEKARGTSDPSVRADLLQGRYRAALCRLAGGQKEPARAALEAALMLKGSGRTASEAEGSAFLAWLQGKAAPPELLAYRTGDERWAGFSWRSQTEEGEFQVGPRFSPTATAWRAILQEIQKRYPDCWAADYSLARIYAHAGAGDPALALLKKVSAAAPEWWAPHFALGDYYTRLRDKENGVPALRRAVALAPGCRRARVMLSLLSGLKEEDPPANGQQ